MHAPYGENKSRQDILPALACICLVFLYLDVAEAGAADVAALLVVVAAEADIVAHVGVVILALEEAVAALALAAGDGTPGAVHECGLKHNGLVHLAELDGAVPYGGGNADNGGLIDDAVLHVVGVIAHGEVDGAVEVEEVLRVGAHEEYVLVNALMEVGSLGVVGAGEYLPADVIVGVLHVNVAAEISLGRGAPVAPLGLFLGHGEDELCGLGGESGLGSLQLGGVGVGDGGVAGANHAGEGGGSLGLVVSALLGVKLHAVLIDGGKLQGGVGLLGNLVLVGEAVAAVAAGLALVHYALSGLVAGINVFLLAALALNELDGLEVAGEHDSLEEHGLIHADELQGAVPVVLGNLDDGGLGNDYLLHGLGSGAHVEMYLCVEGGENIGQLAAEEYQILIAGMEVGGLLEDDGLLENLEAAAHGCAGHVGAAAEICLGIDYGVTPLGVLGSKFVK